jgi:hypothetical protein
MQRMSRLFILLTVACLLTVPGGQALGTIILYGQGSIAGDAVDTSGLTGNLEDGTPHNRLGALGSAIAYTGFGTRYVAAPDRGPADGTTSYLDRYYLLDLTVSGGVVTPTLVQTTLLKNNSGQFFTGNAAAFDAINSPASLRLDPEGIRVGRTGNLFISDEYGPFVYKFAANGQRLQSLTVPAKFLIQSPGVPSADPAIELKNTSGRQANRGMEGLAISPDGSKLYGIMQNPLIQDHGLDSKQKRVGLNTRILEMDVKTGATREFLYQLNDKGYGVNEIVAINDHQFLVVERDGKGGNEAVFKKIFLIDLTNATDISNIEGLPQTGTPGGVTPVTKTEFINLLAPAFGLAGATFPEKIEGLAFGPDLADGRHLLWVTSDNDLNAANPNYFFAFAIDSADLPGFQAQTVVPVPATVWLLGSALLGLAACKRKRGRTQKED